MSEYKGPDRRKNGGSEQFVVVKSWQTLILVGTMLGSAILCYASLRDAAEENARRIMLLEQKALSREVYDVGQQTTNSRLDRIEDKLDAQDVREYKRAAAAKKASE